jgi:N-acetylmuramoyl-L-alanine amidase
MSAIYSKVHNRGTAVLFELGFIDRKLDRDLMNSSAGKDRMVDALYRGILRYEGLAKNV